MGILETILERFSDDKLVAKVMSDKLSNLGPKKENLAFFQVRI